MLKKAVSSADGFHGLIINSSLSPAQLGTADSIQSSMTSQALHEAAWYTHCHNYPALASSSSASTKGKGPSQECRQGTHLPSLGHEPITITWPVWCQTYGYLPSCRASLPLNRYKLHCLAKNRGTCMWTTCPRLLTESETAWSQVFESRVQRPNHDTTRPPPTCKLTAEMLSRLPVNETCQSGSDHTWNCCR